ncbi:alanine racemase [Rhodoplanes sp. TEM]|uniref:Alanine racemase n=1 Tax=Rhodoplanes tepidamans TaxID=200616 RepID=A0ABT5JFC0_RHOTP|nr:MULTISPECIES: alanine racemase [Rhodoplanes]MDC7788312.1 alanine racemase [Rhodoplanes tepidamans]MDC7986208.1 alanine racemase [Rhodoplanes sp. TEM]MDQ0355635.1 alanine racemase [Rhodoplanes tepidamans]
MTVQERTRADELQAAAGAAAAPPSVPVAEAGPPVMETGGVLTIDLAAIVANWTDLARRVAPADCAAVVKADAYGCGLVEVAGALARAGCRTFFVAHLTEARTLRRAVPEAVIYVLNGIPPAGSAAFADARVRPVIGSMPELVEWDAFCRVNAWRGGAALHVDTGMNRLGLSLEEAAALAVRVDTPDHGIALVMSHLACAEQTAHPLNDRQIQAFREVRMLFRGIDASLANSSGIFLGPSTHCEMVRPGAALYGINPTPGAPNPMRPVVRLEARVVQVRKVRRGETVGYGASWTAPRESRIAVAAVGYGDGFLRAAAAVGQDKPVAVVVGKRCPIVGRISMDLLAIDVTALPEVSPRRGDWVTLLGEEFGVDAAAPFGSQISYEVLTSLGRRYHRSWRS